MYSQHLLNVLNSGTGDSTFFIYIVMFNNSVNQIFQYNGSPITFQKGDSVMVNATEMAKPFGKLAKDWLSNKSTKEFLSTLSAVRTIPLTDLVEIKQGGNSEQGTWMHEDVALEFARWLSPAFAIWCNDRIKELLKTGVTTVSNDDEAIAYAMQVLNRRLEQAKAEKQQLEQQNAKLQPKADFADAAFKKIRFSFGSMESLRIFVVLQIIIYYAQGIFYAQKASILKIYREVVSVYHSLWRMIVCSKIGYGFSFFYY
jgi:hypothetical protein|nr:MAG TPA: KilA protein [Caudoviricetes sp.]